MRAISVDCWPGDAMVLLGMSDQKKQLEKFKDAARELECDDDERRFKERLGKLVKSVPPKDD